MTTVVDQRRDARKTLSNVREARLCPQQFELREVPNGTGGTDLKFEGFACVTNVTYVMTDWLGDFAERVMPGAFRKTIAAGADVRFLVNHAGLVLARTKPGTLKLSEQMTGSLTGLFSEARLDPRSPHVVALRSAVEREDLDEMSFSFRVPMGGQNWNADYDDRTILECDLDGGDVSPVNQAANPATGGTVSVRHKSSTAALGAGRGGVAVPVLSAVTMARAKLALAKARGGPARPATREGKTISADTMSILQEVLDELAEGDVDAASALIEDLMGADTQDDARMASLASRVRDPMVRAKLQLELAKGRKR